LVRIEKKHLRCKEKEKENYKSQVYRRLLFTDRKKKRPKNETTEKDVLWSLKTIEASGFTSFLGIQTKPNKIIDLLTMKSNPYKQTIYKQSSKRTK
jgi:hypothetical protein